MSSKSERLRVCVFGSSSSKTPQYILDESFKLGQMIAQRDLVCVHGGGKFGVMGALNRGAESCSGRIIGVIHESFLVDTQENHGMVVTRGNDLNERKQVLFDTADCFVVMPGGFGTLDELFDFLCAKGLQMKGVAGKPIVLVNLKKYYDGTVAQLRRAEADSLLYAPVSSSLHVTDTAEEALAWCVVATAGAGPAAASVRHDEFLHKEAAEAGGLSSAGAPAAPVDAWMPSGLHFLLGLAVGGLASYCVRTFCKKA
jgi:uncharacterized protein (TIGR00730 family)